ncbi:hypothetical protein QN382_19930 [Pseudomonas sp. 10B1]|uniref:hypothetical protein n=1 Tax=Pseudomonas sp. 10B1 TaxID=3048573 RepID=UPI002B227F8D|nr:hypothetical protein [Pseudomonas sp. 10B1]MEB0311547.1 hypothetical protein [Pseudomonas sp. 10B1]
MIQHMQPDQMANGFKFEAGDSVLFTSSQSGASASVSARVVRRLTDDEADMFDVGPMYELDTGSSETVDAFEDELVAA